MNLTDIRLQNYRSYLDDSFEFEPGVNIIVGPNGVGKTNLLEAIMVVLIGKSFRGKDMVLVNNDSDWLRLDAHNSLNQTRVVKIVKKPDQKTEKTFELDEKVYKKLSPKISHPVVLFQPNDLLLLISDPSTRRAWMDGILEKTEVGYTKILTDYRRALSQRNALLKQSRFSDSQLFAWNLRLCELANEIVKKRLELVELIDGQLSESYSSIANSKTNLNAEYVSKTDFTDYSSQLMRQLDQHLEIDRIRGYTSRGPHRDDISFMIDGRLLSEVASRGETRTLILALKTMELGVCEQKLSKKPLLLLDDVFSELDGSRRRSLTKYLNDYQTIITTTDADVLLKNFTRATNTILL